MTKEEILKKVAEENVFRYQTRIADIQGHEKYFHNSRASWRKPWMEN